jgi:hypothetical protein
MIWLLYLIISMISAVISLVCFVGTVSTILEGGTIQAIDALVGGLVLGTASAAASVITYQRARKG